MKTVLLVLIMLTGLGFSQARLGYSEYEIRSEYDDIYWTSFYGSSGTKYLLGMYPDYHIYHALNEKGYCTVTMVIPLSKSEIARRTALYDQLYFKLSNFEWLDRAILIEFKFSTELDAYVFVFSKM